MKVRKKQVVVEAFTFDELVQYGRDHGANIVNGMPWSFTFVAHYMDEDGNPATRDHPITHENDDCYILPTLEGNHKMRRGDMMIVGIAGEIYPCKPDIFAATYEPVGSPALASDDPEGHMQAIADAAHDAESAEVAWQCRCL